MTDLLALWLAAAPLMISPGPAVLSVAAMGAAFGPRRAFKYFLGIVFGTASVLLAVVSGLTGALFAVPGLAPAATLLAAGYILYLAYRIATAPPLGPVDPGAPAPSFGGGYALAIANPKAFAAFGALSAGTTMVPNDPVADAVAKLAGLSAMIVVANGSWLLFGSVLSTVLRDPTASRAVNILFAVLLVGSVALAALG